MFLYDTHVHTSYASACAKCTPKEAVRAYKEIGFTGFILTEHFVHGCTSVPKDLDWTTRMNKYYESYLEAKEEADKLDFDVFFGLEHWYKKSKEILVYGVSLEFLIEHPELETVEIDEFAKIIHQEGGILVHAHPHRIRDYIDPDFKPYYEPCDGIEIYNAGDEMDINELALQDAYRLNKIMTSGGDVHRAHLDRKIGKGGMAFPKRLNSIYDFIDHVKKRNCKFIMDGEVRVIE